MFVHTPRVRWKVPLFLNLEKCLDRRTFHCCDYNYHPEKKESRIYERSWNIFSFQEYLPWVGIEPANLVTPRIESLLSWLVSFNLLIEIQFCLLFDKNNIYWAIIFVYYRVMSHFQTHLAKSHNRCLEYEPSNAKVGANCRIQRSSYWVW